MRTLTVDLPLNIILNAELQYTFQSVLIHSRRVLPLTIMSSDCGNGGGADTFTGLRIGSVFIILATSSFGAFFPVLTKRSKWLKVPTYVFESVFLFFFSSFSMGCLPDHSFAKYFGSGVIVSSSL